MKHELTYTVETGISLTDLGTVWPVRLSHGKCGCGVAEMSSIIAYFTGKESADSFIHMMTNANRHAG